MSGLWDMVVGGIKDWIIQKVVQQAILKIATMWNPAGAIIQLIETAWNVYQWVRENAQRIFGLVQAVVDSISNIVAGNIGGAANFIEASLAKLVPIAISLFADLIGLGGIADKIKGIIEKVQTKVDEAIDKLIARVMAMFKGKGDKKGSDENQDKKPESDEVPKSLAEPNPVSVDKLRPELSDALFAAPSGAVLYQAADTNPAQVTKNLLNQHPDAHFDSNDGQLTLPPGSKAVFETPQTLSELGQLIAKQTGVSKVTITHQDNEITFEGHINPNTTLGRWDFSKESDRRRDDLAHGGYYKRKAWRTRLEAATYSDHGRKHLRARSEDEAKKLSSNGGPAQYLPGIDNGALEREALQNGTVISGEPSDPGSTVKVRYDCGRPVGYFNGEAVSTIRAEITSGNIFHGHPRKF